MVGHKWLGNYKKVPDAYLKKCNTQKKRCLSKKNNSEYFISIMKKALKIILFAG